MTTARHFHSHRAQSTPHVSNRLMHRDNNNSDRPGEMSEWARALFEGIDDAVFVHDDQGRILEANPAACRRLGYTRDEFLRLTTRDIDAPDFAAGFADRFKAQMQTGRFQCEGRHRTKDGRVIPVDINTAAIQINGQPAVLAVMRDITARKEAEEAVEQQRHLLRSILNNMGDAVVSADDQSQVIGFNPAAERLFGKECKLLGLTGSPENVLYCADRTTPFPRDRLPLARAIRGEKVEEIEIFIRHAGIPEGVWTGVTAWPLREESGALAGGISVFRDITERKHAESLQEMQFAVARALAEGGTLEESARNILQAVCQCLHFDVAALWEVDEKDQFLECLEFWRGPNAAVPEFEAMTRRIAFPPGLGLPGRVWASGQAHWLAEIATDPNFPRATVAMLEGLRAGFAFPIQSAGKTIGIIEIFNCTVVKQDDDLLSTMAALGNQIGQVLQRQRLEKALRDSETLYHSLVECLPQNIFRKDRAGRVTFGNQRYAATLNRPLEEIIGKTDFDLFPVDLARKYVADDQRVMQSGGSFEAVEEHCLPDGSKIYVQVVKTPVQDAQGEIIGTQAIFWDVTERRRAEEAVRESERRYRQLTEATQDGIIVADQTGIVTLFNPAAEKMFGYTALEVVGRPITMLMAPEYQGLHERGLQRFVQTRQSRIIGRVVEMQGRRKDGSEFPIEIALTVLGSRGEDTIQFLAALRDLTERNHMRTALVQNEKLASIGLLSAGVAHEINNPLAFVANNLAVLERDGKALLELLDVLYASRERLALLDAPLAERVQTLAEDMDLSYVRDNWPRLLARTREGVDRVSRIVQSMRGFARTDAPKKKETSLPDLVESSLEIVRGKLKRHNIEVVQEHDPAPRVSCVHSQISQVFLNLFVNAVQAIEAAKKPSGRITVKTRRLADEMLIEISDTGCGIEPALLPRIFDPFYTTKDVGQGTGLGLSISHNIITGHGGRIDVDSKPGHGTCFRIYLPLSNPS
jgi:PAS domain S-box-containing protein